MSVPALIVTARLIVAGICLWSCAAKMLDLPRFRQGLVRQWNVPRSAASFVAVAIVGGELAAVILLLIGQTAAIGALVAATLFLLFSAALTTQLIRGNRGPCHCFGYSPAEQVSAAAAVRSVALLALSLAVFSYRGFPVSTLSALSNLGLVTVALGAVMVLRSSGFWGAGWRYWNAPVQLPPRQLYRVSYKHQPLSEETMNVTVPVSGSHILDIERT